MPALPPPQPRGLVAGRRCAGPLGAGSRLGRTGAGLHSRCASGPRLAALRLAGPIDSLVRVSRRVGKAHDNRPRTRGALSRSYPGSRNAQTPRRHRERLQRGGLAGFPGDQGPTEVSARRLRPRGRRGPSSIPRSVPPAQSGRAIGSPARPPVGDPAWSEAPHPAGLCRRPNRSRAPRPGEVHAAERRHPRAPPPRVRAGTRWAPRRPR